VPAKRGKLRERCERLMDEADVPFIKKEAARCLDGIRKALSRVADQQLAVFRRKAHGHMADGSYAKAIDVLSEFPMDLVEELPGLNDRIKALRREIDQIAREDYETLVQRRVDYLVERERFQGAAYVLRRARERFVGFNKILDGLDALRDEVAEKRKAFEAAVADRPPRPRPKPKPVPKPKPKPKPKPVPKPSSGSGDSGDVQPGPYGAMGGGMTEVTDPMGKARKAYSLARKYDRLSQPGAENYDRNLELAVKHYRQAQEYYELCQDNGIGNRSENEEILTEINQSLFWCQKRRRLGR
jgi:hypothetical protein